ncbi:hypothetical protein C7C46_21740 [Streptomyces tateyamensis]|uniref:Uncharacterized protein n=1 Tax=Streptomyces tateyamensis TaxID=565073 RepID=A0A2V4N5J4_9ACTN|nr:hypothetical protein [Streptomyces tateyamensis]PYC76806.1 hypothetical protein C7C46_21740 [Streptomyces tateyamensis]
MPSRPRLLPALIAALGSAAVLASVSGCSGAADAAVPAPAATPTVLNSAALHLPTDDYQLSPEATARLGRATQLVVGQCMKGYGLSVDQSVAGAKSAPATATEMRYGVTNPEQAKTTGYHFGPADEGYLPPSAAPTGPPPNTDPEYQQVLRGNGTPGTTEGTATTYHGKNVPAGGCVGEMHTKLQAGATFLGVAALVRQIDSQSFTEAMKTPAVQAAFQSWSSCMLAKGFHYATPIDAVNDKAFRTDTASPTELATAQADVACKQQGNVVGVWFAAEVDRQHALMQPHVGELKTIKMQMQDQAAAVAEVLQAAGQ